MIDKLLQNATEELEDIFKKIDDVEEYNSEKILNSFIENNICETDLYGSTGYGYGDIGRGKIERVYADVFKTESALVRTQFISGTHAISTCLFALLRPNDILLSITGKPYDTLDSIIGFNNNKSSLKSFGIKYRQIDLINNDFDYDKIRNTLRKEKIKVIEIQRSKGYSTRESISIDKIEKVIKVIREISAEVIIMVDNCYCELVGKKEPTEVGADICVGSLIKNLGGAIATNGGYIVGRKELLTLCAERLNVPGQDFEVGPSLGQNRYILEGLYFSPMVVANALKTSIFTAYMFEKLGYDVSPKYNDERVDIVQNIIFRDKDKLIKYVRQIQKNSKIDSNSLVEPSDMPGYEDKIIIELSCDGPLRTPYIAYQQGGISYQYGKIIISRAIKSLLEN